MSVSLIFPGVVALVVLWCRGVACRADATPCRVSAQQMLRYSLWVHITSYKCQPWPYSMTLELSIALLNFSRQHEKPTCRERAALLPIKNGSLNLVVIFNVFVLNSVFLRSTLETFFYHRRSWSTEHILNDFQFSFKIPILTHYGYKKLWGPATA